MQRPKASEDAEQNLVANAIRPRRLRFGDFEFAPETLELHGPDRTLRLQPQPAKLLLLLISHRGAVVSREAVRQRLWPGEIHVEFDQSMNSCVKRIRMALGDSADDPSYIETLPRVGYRFLQPVTAVESEEKPLPESPPAPTPSTSKGARKHLRLHTPLGLAALVASIVILATLVIWGTRKSTPDPAENGAPPVLAVLPFAALDDWAGAESFRQALAQELITSLARQGPVGLAVVAQTTTSDGQRDGPALRPNADFLLDGHIQRDQGRVRVWARLVLVDDGTVLWTDAYDGTVDDLMRMQAEVSARVDESVRQRLRELLGPDTEARLDQR